MFPAAVALARWMTAADHVQLPSWAVQDAAQDAE
jgi:hypothetical protein